MHLLDEVKTYRKMIKTDNSQISLFEICSMYDNKEIIIAPDFQRLFRWSRQQQSDFIESLILEIPIPPLYFYEDEDGNWELIDGLQRVSTIIKFMSPKISIPKKVKNVDDDWYYENENNIDAPLCLKPGDYLKGLTGHTFENLPIPLRRNLKRWRLDVVVLKRETEAYYKYEVFKRLNTSGSELSDQEKRNCGVRLIDREFPEFIKKIAENKDFSESLGITEEKEKSLYHQELALRFFAMKNCWQEFDHDVAIFLTKYMEKVARKSCTFDKTSEQEDFEQTFKIINTIFPEGDGFKWFKRGKRWGGFSPNIFEIVTIAVSMIVNKNTEIDYEQLKIALEDLVKKDQTRELSGQGANSKKKTQGRVKLAQKFACDWLAKNEKRSN